MPVHTNNAYGQIFISDLAIAKVASHAAKESYGIVQMASRRTPIDLILYCKKDAEGRGVKVTTSGNKIFVDVSVIMKYGISINAVADSLKEEVKYKLEVFTGMLVDTINVNVVGVKQ